MIKIIIDISSVYWPKQFGVCYHRKSEGMSCTKKPANKQCVWDIHCQTMIYVGHDKLALRMTTILRDGNSELNLNNTIVIQWQQC